MGKSRVPEPKVNREAWLGKMADILEKELFKKKSLELPKYRVSVGFPYGVPKAIGQCFGRELSADETEEIFICPTQSEAFTVTHVLLHEMIHACVGAEAKHGPKFRAVAVDFGLEGKMTGTTPGPTLSGQLNGLINQLVEKIGPYPHATLKKGALKKAKPSGWVRYMSETDDTYKVVVSQKKVEECGAPKDPWGKDMVPNVS